MVPNKSYLYIHRYLFFKSALTKRWRRHLFGLQLIGFIPCYIYAYTYNYTKFHKNLKNHLDSKTHADRPFPIYTLCFISHRGSFWSLFNTFLLYTNSSLCLLEYFTALLTSLLAPLSSFFWETQSIPQSHSLTVCMWVYSPLQSVVLLRAWNRIHATFFTLLSH